MGQAVTLLDDLSTGSRDNVLTALQNAECRLVEGSIRDPELVEQLMAECDQVYHLAAAVGVQLIVDRPVHTIETNIHGSEVVFNAAAKAGRLILLASTSEVYGKRTSVPFREDDDMVYGCTKFSRWSYAASKAIDEFLALAYHREQGLPVIIARLFNTIGPRQSGAYGMVVPRFVRAALAGEPVRVYGDGRQSRCFCDVDDVVRALVGLMAEPKAVGDVFNVGADTLISIEQLARQTIELTGGDSTIEYVPYDRAYGPGFDDLQIRQPCLEKIEALIGYRPTTTLEQTLQRIIDWTRQGPRVPGPPEEGRT